jgi:hypothetical protein
VLWQLASQSEANNLWQHHGNGLTEHDRLCLNTTDSPSGNTEAIDHGGVRVSSNDRIVVEQAIAIEDDASEVLKVDLMHDTRAWRNDLEVVKGFRTPFEELEALSVSVELNDLVLLGSIRSTKHISLNGVVNNEIYRAQRVDLGWVSTESVHGVSHGSEIDNSRNTSEILKNDSGGFERDVSVSLRGLCPVEDCLNV